MALGDTAHHRWLQKIPLITDGSGKYCTLLMAPEDIAHH